MNTTNFFDISLNSLNLFSIMIGMSLVVMSSYWSGRIRYTRVVFAYLAGLAFYFGAIKQYTPPVAPVVTERSVDAHVPNVSDYTGRGRK